MYFAFCHAFRCLGSEILEEFPPKDLFNPPGKIPLLFQITLGMLVF